jgi:hypothetical protein
MAGATVYDSDNTPLNQALAKDNPGPYIVHAGRQEETRPAHAAGLQQRCSSPAAIRTARRSSTWPGASASSGA